jgi:hypothetical protein
MIGEFSCDPKKKTIVGLSVFKPLWVLRTLVIPGEVTKTKYSYKTYSFIKNASLKGTVSRDFLLKIFFMNQGLGGN